MIKKWYQQRLSLIEEITVIQYEQLRLELWEEVSIFVLQMRLLQVERIYKNPTTTTTKIVNFQTRAVSIYMKENTREKMLITEILLRHSRELMRDKEDK